MRGLARVLATATEPGVRDPGRAVELAKKVVHLLPASRDSLNTLGTAHYRAGDWQAAIATLEKSVELGKGRINFIWFVLAMAHWQLDQKEEARKWYDEAVEWMDKNSPQDKFLLPFRAEAAKLLDLESQAVESTPKN